MHRDTGPTPRFRERKTRPARSRPEGPLSMEKGWSTVWCITSVMGRSQEARGDRGPDFAWRGGPAQPTIKKIYAPFNLYYKAT